MLEGPFATGKEIPRTSSGGRDRSFSRARRGSERHQAGAAGRGEPPAACNVDWRRLRGWRRGGGEAATCTLGGDPSCDVLVHALAAASDRSRPAAIALRLRGRPHMDVIMQRAAHRPAVGLRQNAFGRILYSTHAIAQWRMIEGYHRRDDSCRRRISDDDVMATETRFDEGRSHEQP